MLLTVLVADDESIERLVIQKIITDSQLPAVVLGFAKSGNEIVQLAELHQPDLIFMDISMPGLNGLDASALIKENHPETIISIITAYDEFSYAKKAIDIHLDYYLLKPLIPEELLAIIRKTIKLKFKESNHNIQMISPKRMKLAEDIVKTMHTHYNKAITLSFLETQLNASQQYLSRTFKEAYHTTIMNYLQNLRLKHALELLKNPDSTISEVSEAVGFADPSYFGQLFFRANGLSPLQYQYQHFNKSASENKGQ